MSIKYMYKEELRKQSLATFQHDVSVTSAEVKGQPKNVSSLSHQFGELQSLFRGPIPGPGDVCQRDASGPAMGTLEGQAAGGEAAKKPAALRSGQGVPEAKGRVAGAAFEIGPMPTRAAVL